jgi:hypothetical protein
MIGRQGRQEHQVEQPFAGFSAVVGKRIVDDVAAGGVELRLIRAFDLASFAPLAAKDWSAHRGVTRRGGWPQAGGGRAAAARSPRRRPLCFRGSGLSLLG